MQISGTIKLIKETETIGTNGFRKRQFVVTTDEQYPQHVLIEMTQDKCVLLDNYKEGDGVTAHINIRGREHVKQDGETQYFNTLQCWKIERAGSTQNSTTQQDNF